MVDDFVSKAFDDAWDNSISEQQRAYNELEGEEINAAFRAACTLVGMDNMTTILGKLDPNERDILAGFGNIILMAGFHIGYNKAKMSAQ